jgi:hypothetical protein
MFRACALGIALGACTLANEPVPAPGAALDENVFRCSVEPILVKQCSYLACHGISGAALRVYSPAKLRAIPPQSLDDAVLPLTDAEHHANFESAAGFAFMVPNPEDNFLLRKPLPARDGGYEHQGGAIWADAHDAQYVAIRDWLSGRGVCK